MVLHVEIPVHLFVIVDCVKFSVARLKVQRCVGAITNKLWRLVMSRGVFFMGLVVALLTSGV